MFYFVYHLILIVQNHYLQKPKHYYLNLLLLYDYHHKKQILLLYSEFVLEYVYFVHHLNLIVHLIISKSPNIII